jgi:hypothetical protein
MNLGPDSFEFTSEVVLSSSFNEIDVSTNFSMSPDGITVTTDLELDSIEATLDIQLSSG